MTILSHRSTTRAPACSPPLWKWREFSLSDPFDQGAASGLLLQPSAHKAFLDQTLGPEQVTNGEFDGDASGWGGVQATLASVSNELEMTSTATNWGQAVQNLALTVGDWVHVSGYARKGTNSGNAEIAFWDGATQHTVVLDTDGSGVSDGKFYQVQASGCVLKLNGYVNAVGQTAYFDSVSVTILSSGAQDAILYKDSAGTTPAANDSDPVGLALEISKWGGKTLSEYLAGQSELVTNGTFDTDTAGWSPDDATLSVDAGRLKVVTSGDYGRAVATLSGLTVGAHYQVTADFTREDTNGALQISANSDGSGEAVDGGQVTSSNSATLSFIFAAGATTRYLVCQNNIPTNAVTSYWDNISVKEAEGEHFYQTTDANRPTLENDGALYRLKGNGTNQYLEGTPFAYDAGAALLAFAIKAPSSQSDRQFYSEGNSADNNPIYAFGNGSGGSADNLRIFVRNDAGATLADIVSSTSLFDDNTHVLSILDTGSAFRFWIDAVEDANSGAAYTRTGALSTDRSALFSLAQIAISSHLNGEIFDFIGIEGGTDEATRKKIEAVLAENSGATLLA